MKWTQSLLILVLLLGFPLFQADQITDIEWVICEKCFAVKSEDGDTHATNCLWYDSEPEPSLFNRIGLVFQLKNPLSVLYSSFQKATPFWKPPPV